MRLQWPVGCRIRPFVRLTPIVTDANALSFQQVIQHPEWILFSRVC